MKIILNSKNPPLGGVIVANYIKSTANIAVEWNWGDETFVDNFHCKTSNDVARAISTVLFPDLYGSNPTETTAVDHWLTFAIGPLSSNFDFYNALQVLDKCLGHITYLANKRLSIADFIVFATLYASKSYQELVSKDAVPTNIKRWYRFIQSQDAVKITLNSLTSEQLGVFTSAEKSVAQSSVKDAPNASGRAREGKFIDLPGAEMGKVVVRFPPEASGYLHIGHAKAALLNQYYQEAFNGKLIMRFDDTNPAKENLHFEKVILEDVAMLDIKPDAFTHTSQYFDLMLDYCEKLIKDGKAYVDDTDAELMKQQREQKIESANRNISVEKNLRIWDEMKKGSNVGQTFCVRAKIDMQSANGCMRDPTIYRCKNEPHPKTGDKYKVYPTYDFACPIVDAIEGVTHTLRTMEYHDRDPQFYWFIDALELRKPYIWEYSRLSMTNTVLSKRKLTWFVEEGLVDGWDDPRMPTVRGVLRRGMTVEGLKEFIIAQGSSRSVVFMEWDKIWAFNKKVIDPIAPRFTAVECDDPVVVLVNDVKAECLTVPKHPKNPSIGDKTVWIGPRLLIDRVDADNLKEGEKTTFINWGNLLIKKINHENNKITTIEAEPNLDNKDFKKTLKITWLADVEQIQLTATYCVYFDHLISKALLGKEEDFKDYVNHDTRKEIKLLGDPELKSLKKGDIIEIQRKGFFKVDVAYEPYSPYIGKEQPVILFYIPDGRTKDSPFSTTQSPIVKQNQQVSINQSKPSDSNDLSNQLQQQADKVRKLKADKVDKSLIDAAVKVLLALKAEYKQTIGNDWVATASKKTPSSSTNKTIQKDQDSNANDEFGQKVQQQADKVRKLKGDKAEKSAIDSEVKVLLALKAEYKQATGKDWVAAASQKPSSRDSLNSTKADKIEQAAHLENLQENNELAQKVQLQADKVRKLKSDKAGKSVIDSEVKILLALKAEYKQATGKDWVAVVLPKPSSRHSLNSTKPDKIAEQTQDFGISQDNNELSQKVQQQADKVRKLKADKAGKSIIDAEVKNLLALKAEYKQATGNDWVAAAPQKPSSRDSLNSNTVNPIVEQTQDFDISQGNNELAQKVQHQADKVRQLKSDKADKLIINSEVQILLALKSQYKELTGKDWVASNISNKPPSNNPSTPVPVLNDRNSLLEKVNAQGDKVRELKAKKADKEDINKAVEILLQLKVEYKEKVGEEVPVVGKKSNDKPTAKPKQNQKDKKPLKEEETTGLKKQTRLGLEAKKEESLSDWYSQVITKGELIEYYDVSGCYIFRPWAYSIWETIQTWLDAEIKNLDVQNCYFPMFVSRNVLEKEKTHIADFAPEVAWVTKSGDSDLAEPIAVRPTSETVMYPAYAKWIQSYRDLPIKLNQWNNVVRWEFKHPQPFLRTREFLWQEGHSAYAEREEAVDEVHQILNLYAYIYENLLAIPVIKGRKTEKEKFAGGDFTLTVEAFISASGRAIQGATSHHLGQNFSTMFEIIYEDPETQEKKYVYQNSWGITTRTIGVMIMVHADNQGLILPPNVATIQVIIVPCGITVNLDETDKKILEAACLSLENNLKLANIRVKVDYRQNYSPGWKFNHWELKGVPIRIELGPKDIAKEQLVAVRRDTGEKLILPLKFSPEKINELLQNIQENLFQNAYNDLNSHKVQLSDWSEFCPNLDNKNIILAPFCGETDCEDRIKADSARDDNVEPGAPSMGAKTLCIPLSQPAEIKATDKCIHPLCKNKPIYYTLFGRSY